jgi:hypothetical protein
MHSWRLDAIVGFLSSAAFVDRLSGIDLRVVDEFARVQANKKGEW